jgi:glutathione S-transferase
MEPVLFYGIPEGCSFGSIIALEWASIPYRLCRIDMMDADVRNHYRSLLPLGETPALMTADGRIMAESMAILHHIGHIASNKELCPTTGSKDFDHMNERLAFLNTSFFDAFSPLWHLYEASLSESEKAVFKAYGQEKVTAAHAALADKLAGDKWLAGDHPTLADAYFYGIARWDDYHGTHARANHPTLTRLFAELEKDPAVQFAHAIERGEEPAGAGHFRGHVTLGEMISKQQAA